VPVAYTVSIGVATLALGETLAGLMARADAALHAAKAKGRNRVVSAPLPPRVELMSERA
jgi:PleD family two-component response regulator